ncbi:putative protein involved in outer membrane biogenesis [Thalassovita gelatinovora]|uniref:YhdP central domain-containing protein n=1 Tax=Thalassovita gelatinovora TaxID=53501 RepID=A0A0N7LUA1_THAGE|nr:DUF3971 domain-containing protein [Thalassovita gelatinovora]QIZ79502.1 hypothetical protein HFZ77_02920 [Thalassovita gelatinovora]CUH62922.1 putative protein involved in outer membrane biogenesis [Thalassovita gelatinovora]SEQ12473.1 AsmA-like C-terminal region [Thalassovita gelatinovora]
MSPKPEGQQSKRLSRKARAALWVGGGILAVLALAVWLVYSAIGRPIRAPEWLQQRIETRLGQMLPDMDVTFGALSVLLTDTGRPRVQLRDVEISQSDGPVILTMSDLETGLALAPLLKGKAQLGRISLSGAEINVTRRKDGSFDLSFGTSLPQVEQSASIQELVAGLDRLLLSEQFANLSRVDADAMIVRYEDLRSGRAWTIDGGRLRLTRDDDDLRIGGDLALLAGYDYATTVELNFESLIGSAAAQFGMIFEDMAAQDIAVQSAAVAWLDVVRAPISGALRGSVDETGFGDISGTLQIADGVIQPTDQTKPIPFTSARTYFTYSPTDQTLVFDEVSVSSEWITARAEGKAILGGMETGLPQELLGQFTLTGLTANPEDLLQVPLTLDAARMSFRMALDPFVMTMGELTLEEQGQIVVVSGEAAAEPEGWRLSVAAQAEHLDSDVVLALWPEKLKTKTRTWIEENIHQVTLTRGQLAYRKQPGQPHDIYAGFEYDEAEVQFSRHMPPIKNASGHAEINGKTFTAAADHGVIQADLGGRIDISGSSIVIPDTTEKPTPAHVNLSTDSTVTAALSLLDREPLNLMTKAGRTADLADGRAKARGTLDLMLKKKLLPEEVSFDIAADLSNVSSDTLVPQRVLRAGHLDLKATNEMLTISGRGQIGQIGFDAVFEDDLRPEDKGKSRVYGVADLSNAFLDEFSIALPPGSLSGRGDGVFEIALQKDQPPRFSLSSDLRGIGLRLPEIGWALAQNTTGLFEASGRLSSPPVVDRLALTGPGLRTAGALSLKQDGSLNQMRFSSVVAGNWLNAPVTLIGRGKGQAPAVQIAGGWVDLAKRPDTVANGGGSTGSSPISAALDRVQITKSIALTQFRGDFTTGNGFSGVFTGLVNGKAPVSGKVIPVSGRSGIEINSDDAGAVVAAAGLMKTGHNGKFHLTLNPAAQPGQYDGALDISNIRIREAPALAELLNTISVVGLLEQMSGTGILFGEVEARFRLTPDQLILRRSSAVGASMGLSMDGIYDFASNQMDFQGVLSPIYAINAIGSILTRKGEGLIGFNYGLSGNPANPKVQVNPLSIFTPGMFREIFRRPAPEVSQ